MQHSKFSNSLQWTTTFAANYCKWASNKLSMMSMTVYLQKHILISVKVHTIDSLHLWPAEWLQEKASAVNEWPTVCQWCVPVVAVPLAAQLADMRTYSLSAPLTAWSGSMLIESTRHCQAHSQSIHRCKFGTSIQSISQMLFLL